MASFADEGTRISPGSTGGKRLHHVDTISTMAISS